MKSKSQVLFLFFLFFIFSLPSIAHAKANCTLRFNLKSWSVFYKSGKGTGTIICNNGQTVEVKIRASGGGISFGKNQIVNGRGTFSPVHDVTELYGSYAEAEAHAGASKSADARAMKKGKIKLTLSGKGKGWNLGFAFGKFKIKPR